MSRCCGCMKPMDKSSTAHPSARHGEKSILRHHPWEKTVLLDESIAVADRITYCVSSYLMVATNRLPIRSLGEAFSLLDIFRDSPPVPPQNYSTRARNQGKPRPSKPPRSRSARNKVKCRCPRSDMITFEFTRYILPVGVSRPLAKSELH